MSATIYIVKEKEEEPTFLWMQLVGSKVSKYSWQGGREISEKVTNAHNNLRLSRSLKGLTEALRFLLLWYFAVPVTACNSVLMRLYIIIIFQWSLCKNCLHCCNVMRSNQLWETKVNQLVKRKTCHNFWACRGCATLCSMICDCIFIALSERPISETEIHAFVTQVLPNYYTH